MQEGNIVITPFDERNLSTSSYDVTLGGSYYRPNQGEFQQRIYNIYDKKQMERIWGRPQEADLASDMLSIPEMGDAVIPGINPRDKIIIIYPGETILAHTNEFIGGRNHITTMMKARSSMGRSFLGVCKCAGWGDVGYINRWTMEITNYSKTYTIPLVVGRRIAQIVFFETGPILGRDYASAGKYQAYDSVEELKKNWKPESMLPQLYRDRDIV